ncbi:bglB [Symbiodinium sp. CCMP2456]|nr:bglB [Symbiodinium sp. CCMP2456]
MLEVMALLRWIHTATGLLFSSLLAWRLVQEPNYQWQVPNIIVGFLVASRRLPLFLSAGLLVWAAVFVSGVPRTDIELVNVGWNVCGSSAFFSGLLGCVIAALSSRVGRILFVAFLAWVVHVLSRFLPVIVAQENIPRFRPEAAIPETPQLRMQLCSESSQEAETWRKQIGVVCEPIVPLTWEEAEARAAVTLANMTRQERHSLMQGIGWIPMPYGLPAPLPAIPALGHYMGNLPPIPRLGVPPLKLHDAGNGFRNMPGPQGKAGSTVMWPCSLALGASWDVKLVQEVAAEIGREYRGKGSNLILGPSVQVQRVARNGRNFEYMSGEDPYLGAKLSAAYVKGVQGQGVMACLKHFAFNEQETNRMTESSVVDERTAWELYYPPFEAGIAAGAGSVMCSYNRVNGTYACANEELLTRDLKQKMGFKGFVMTDWWALHDPAEMSVVRGLDMEMPGAGAETFLFADKLEAMEEHMGGVFKGYANLKREDLYKEPARRILTAAHKMRFFEDVPSCTPGLDCAGPIYSDQRSTKNLALARRAVRESIVLLQNKGSLLPLTANAKLALIGEAWVAPSRSTEELGMFGDYYSGGGSGHCYLPADRFKTPHMTVTAYTDAHDIYTTSSLSNNVTEALSVVWEADIIVVLAATTAEESRDRPSLHLDNGADELVDALSKVGKPIVVLVQAPGTVVLPWREAVDAVALMFLGGEFTGAGWARLLFGEVSPSGKLPLMIPKHEKYTIEPGQEPDVVYGEGLFTSYRAPSASEAAAFPFGHGLSFTEFAIAAPEPYECGMPLCVSLTVTNIGTRFPGAEVVQAYFEFPPEAQEPRLLLKGFHKTAVLKPGESEKVELSFTVRDFSIYSTALGDWVLQPSVRIHLGVSSADLRHSLDVPLATS